MHRLFLLLLLLLPISVTGGQTGNYKILHLASYHSELPWTAGISAGIGQVLENHPAVNFRTHYMDTKRRPTEEEKKSAALKARKAIDQWQPDLVISSDDNAAKYVIVPFFKNTDIPFVFCGINWNAEEYGFPCSNVTGMIEVQLIDQIIAHMKKFSAGNRIGLIKGDDFSARKEAVFFEKTYNLSMDKRFVKNFEEWSAQYIDLQKDVDMLLIGNTASISGWNPNKAQLLVDNHTVIPTGNWETHMAPYALITLATVAREQGEWAARTALKILGGTPPEDIPPVTNKRADIILNIKLAHKLGIQFPMELMETAHFITSNKPRVLFVNSYHKGYRWSDNIEQGLRMALDIGQAGDDSDLTGSKVSLKIIRLDTKLNRSEEFKEEAARKAKEEIDAWEPDILVVSDDNAMKYLVVPYFRNSEMPVVFCGINANVYGYGLPADNITGMIEIEPAVETIKLLKQLSGGNRLGFIGVDTLSENKTLDSLRDDLRFSDGSLVVTFEEWKKEYLRLQDEVDMLFWFSPVGIKDWDEERAKQVIAENTRIPTGASSLSSLPYALLGQVKNPQEFGWWAGRTALRILDGEQITDMPMTTNKHFRLYLNMELARSMGVVFPPGMLQDAAFLEQEAVK